MRAMFCEDTQDITLILSRTEAERLKSTKEITPFLNAGDKGIEFSLMNSNPKNKCGIQIIEPRSPSYPHYTIKISDIDYESLIRDGRCGTRYGNSSKLSIVIDNDDNF